MQSFSDRVVAYLSFNRHRFQAGQSIWAKKCMDEMTFPDEDASILRKIAFVLMLPFTFFNALLPPTTLLGGYPTFFLALGCIGLLTALINDFAALFGCQIGLSDATTATTIVALGTSLPDTMASRIAAQNEATADASITNVTGSNTVNVLLGLGIAWSVSSIYWSLQDGDSEAIAEWRLRVPLSISEEYPNGAFYVPAGDLVFSVILFSCSSVVVFCVLYIQRIIPQPIKDDETSLDETERMLRQLGGELGGPRRKLVASFFVLLWISYIIITSLKSEGLL
eukprot:m.194764 g.194764  ORF g.194764 m.194764 type:complete len:281 (-) comp15680_c0_seq5:48-890(-)